MHNEEINKARIFIYNVLALLFVEEHVKMKTPLIIENLKLLQENAFNQASAHAVGEIVLYLEKEEENTLYKIYQELFLVPFGQYVSLSSSLYHEQREAGIMLVRVRDVLAQTSIRRDEKTFKAPEDHYGFIFTLCAYLIEQNLTSPTQKDLHKELFDTVINPHIDQLVFSLIQSQNEIYAKVGVFLEAFIHFERSYLEI